MGVHYNPTSSGLTRVFLGSYIIEALIEKTIIYIEFAFLCLPVDRNATVNVHKIRKRLPNFINITSKQEN